MQEPRQYVPYHHPGSFPQEPPEEELTYDDILESLNVRLYQGKLQAMSRQEQQWRKSQSYALPANANYGRITNAQKSQQYKKFSPKTPVQTILPSNPYQQNSYIYNKYFKDFAQTEQVAQPVKPMTRQEYVVFMRKKAAEDAAQRKRIREVKSTKLLLNNGSNEPIQIHTASAGAWNKMFSLKGV